MTKKDYIAIAKCIADARANPEHFYVSAEPQYTRGVNSAAVALAVALKADNPRFDRERFLRACGIDTA